MNGRNPQHEENEDRLSMDPEDLDKHCPTCRCDKPFATVMSSRIPCWFDLLVECKALIVKARADLGDDLGGFSVIDLLCDNTEEGTDVLELVMKDLGETP